MMRALFDHYVEHPPPPLTPDATEQQRVVAGGVTIGRDARQTGDDLGLAVVELEHARLVCRGEGRERALNVLVARRLRL